MQMESLGNEHFLITVSGAENKAHRQTTTRSFVKNRCHFLLQQLTGNDSTRKLDRISRKYLSRITSILGDHVNHLPQCLQEQNADKSLMHFDDALHVVSISDTAIVSCRPSIGTKSLRNL